MGFELINRLRPAGIANLPIRYGSIFSNDQQFFYAINCSTKKPPDLN